MKTPVEWVLSWCKTSEIVCGGSAMFWLDFKLLPIYNSIVCNQGECTSANACACESNSTKRKCASVHCIQHSIAINALTHAIYWYIIFFSISLICLSTSYFFSLSLSLFYFHVWCQWKCENVAIDGSVVSMGGCSLALTMILYLTEALYFRSSTLTFYVIFPCVLNCKFISIRFQYNYFSRCAAINVYKVHLYSSPLHFSNHIDWPYLYSEAITFVGSAFG